MPQTIESPQTMLFPATVVSPQTTELPQIMESSRTMPPPQTIESPQTMESPQVMLVPQAMDWGWVRLAVLDVGSKVAVGESDTPVATSVLPSAASTSRYPAPMVKTSYCAKCSNPHTS